MSERPFPWRGKPGVAAPQTAEQWAEEYFDASYLPQGERSFLAARFLAYGEQVLAEAEARMFDGLPWPSYQDFCSDLWEKVDGRPY
jgi:hypothetical protein